MSSTSQYRPVGLLAAHFDFDRLAAMQPGAAGEAAAGAERAVWQRAAGGAHPHRGFEVPGEAWDFPGRRTPETGNHGARCLSRKVCRHSFRCLHGRPMCVQPSLDSIASQTTVMISTAGPLALYGTPVVDAAVRSGTHYVDITGALLAATKPA